MLSQSERQRVTADTTKSFSECACEATPKGRRECVGVAEKSLVRNGSERSEAKRSDHHPSAKPLLVFRLTAEQAEHLAFSALCQVSELENSHEANEPEVLEAIRSLNESRRILAQGEPT
ncbi:MAG: hypothetical protein WAT12_10245 [Candidatus Nitrotoga sp.]